MSASAGSAANATPTQAEAEAGGDGAGDGDGDEAKADDDEAKGDDDEANDDEDAAEDPPEVEEPLFGAHHQRYLQSSDRREERKKNIINAFKRITADAIEQCGCAAMFILVSPLLRVDSDATHGHVGQFFKWFKDLLMYKKSRKGARTLNIDAGPAFHRERASASAAANYVGAVADALDGVVDNELLNKLYKAGTRRNAELSSETGADDDALLRTNLAGLLRAHLSQLEKKLPTAMAFDGV